MRLTLADEWGTRLIGWVVMIGMNVALGLEVFSGHPTAAGIVLFGVGSFAWEAFFAWLCFPFGDRS